jgi:hypothetical protein
MAPSTRSWGLERSCWMWSRSLHPPLWLEKRVAVCRAPVSAWQVAHRTYDQVIKTVREQIFTEVVSTILAKYRTWQGGTRSSHSLPVLVQLVHASCAHGSERGSQ